MKKKDLYNALSGIDEKYLSDSENFSEISAEFRRTKARKISVVSSLCGSLVIIATVFFNSDIRKIDFNNVPKVIEKSGTIQTDIIMATENKKESETITETAKNISGISSEYLTTTVNNNTANENYTESSEETITSYISDIIEITNNPVIQTEISMTETSEFTSKDITTEPDCDNITDGYDKADFSGISIEEWLENPDVIWSENDTKSLLSTEYISAGNTKISEELSDSMQNNPDSTVYAVMVDFSSCIDENEMLDWEYNGNTIADLRLQIAEVAEYSEDSYTYVDSDGIEHIEYFLTSESEKKVTEIEFKINEIMSAYRNEKIQKFRDSFNNNGLEIYTNTTGGIPEENFCFYTFATKKHLEEFECRSDETFIFYSANYFK
ncbi:MAG: hypothetical protein NC177_02695 [Ruminococcus flavefaciens]|nr:hypothetical protein [Ruminococcus flavefaciens]